MKHKRYFRVPLFLLKMTLILAITGAVFMLLWNALIPELFSGPVLNYWQAAGLLLIAKILFGTMGKGYRLHRHNYPDEIWKQKLREKYEAMTPEEKEKFRSRCKTSFSFVVTDDAKAAPPAAKAETKENL
ncbi:MAG: hypothetical protein UZ05_CHB002000961 [Chlorobi bacterium OLB5]|nr:MAG: hypothetical protein UZ05_CHB002000961 [Chlorobi bacterium OLB5]